MMSDARIREAFSTCRELAYMEVSRQDLRTKLESMCDRGHELLTEGRREKAMRWLGFVQGVLWATGAADLETLKRMNMPDGAVYDAARDAVRRGS